MMKRTRFFDLENHFAFYGAYHSNRINMAIHMLCVWPIVFTALLLFYFTPSFSNLPPYELSVSGYKVALVFNVGFLFTLIYSVFYVRFDPRAGSLASFLCFLCWVSSSFIGSRLGFVLAYKDISSCNGILCHCPSFPLFLFFLIAHRLHMCFSLLIMVVLVTQLVCWTGQFIGHGIFEKRAPALLDNLAQAFLMAPFFVLLEALQLIGYEPYPGFHARVQAKIQAEINEWQDKRQTLIS